MIYALMAWEFLKIGLFAIGGGLVTVPFLFDLSAKYNWFSTAQLTDIIAVAQSVPGPVGINMAAYAGFYTAGFVGWLIAPLSEVLPAMIIIYFIARMLTKWHENKYVQIALDGIRPAVLTLIVYAAWIISKEATLNYLNISLFAVFLIAMHFYKKSPIFYIIIGAIAGICLKI